jgi:hypothetical protein
MTFANVPNDGFACNPSIAAIPRAVNRGIRFQSPDSMYIPEMRWDALACNMSTARPRVTLSGTLTRRCRQAGMGGLCRGYMVMCFVQLSNFWSSLCLSHTQ